MTSLADTTKFSRRCQESPALRLLVSVRDADEAALALKAGVDVLDVKDPENGPLGCPSSMIVAAISRRLAAECLPQRPLFSIAGGEVSDWIDVPAPTSPAVSRFELPVPPDFIKLGTTKLAGRSSEDLISATRQAFDRACEAVCPLASPRRILVAYAEEDLVGAPSLEAVLELTVRLGWSGLLIDTAKKDGLPLLRLQSVERLGQLAVACRRAGLLFALAGKLQGDDLENLAEIGPDFVGIRSAGCDGQDRLRSISAERIREFRARIPQPHGIQTDRSTTSGRQPIHGE